MDKLLAVIIILCLSIITYTVISVVSEPKAKKIAPCRTQFGEDRPQEWCDALK